MKQLLTPGKKNCLELRQVFRIDWMLTNINKVDKEAAVLTREILAVKIILQEHLVEFAKVFIQLIQSLDLADVTTAHMVVI